MSKETSALAASRRSMNTQRQVTSVTTKHWSDYFATTFGPERGRIARSSSYTASCALARNLLQPLPVPGAHSTLSVIKPLPISNMYARSCDAFVQATYTPKSRRALLAWTRRTASVSLLALTAFQWTPRDSKSSETGRHHEKVRTSNRSWVSQTPIDGLSSRTPISPSHLRARVLRESGLCNVSLQPLKTAFTSAPIFHDFDQDRRL